DRGDLALAHRAREGEIAIQRLFDCVARERRAVVELDPAPDLDRVGELVLGDLRHPVGELRDDVQALVEVVELLAHVREDHAPDVRATVGSSASGSSARPMVSVPPLLMPAALRACAAPEPSARRQAAPTMSAHTRAVEPLMYVVLLRSNE